MRLSPTTSTLKSNGNFSTIVANTNGSVPDYFVALLYNRVVGKRVLNATSDDNDVLVYAHCAKNRTGAVTLMYVNPSGSSKVLDISGAGNGDVGGAKAEAYIFTSHDGSLQSDTANVNGQKVVLDSAGHPPAIAADERPLPLSVPAHSYGFVVVGGLGGDACK